MFNTEDPTPYLERAEMHEQLAAATDDIPARKMHLAMAAEYRRKGMAQGDGAIHVVSPSRTDRLLKVDVAIH